MTPRRRAGLLLVLALVPGCAARSSRPAPVPKFEAREPGAARDALIALGRQDRWFHGELRIRGRHAGKRFRARLLADLRSHGRLRLETGRPRPFVMTADGSELRVLFSREREWLRLPATASAVESLIGLPLEPGELGAVLAGLGAPPASWETAVAESATRWKLERGWLALGADGAVERGELRGLSFRIETDVIRFAFPARKLSMEIERIASRAAGSVAEVAAADLFRPQPPAGFTEVSLVRSGEPALLPGED